MKQTIKKALETLDQIHNGVGSTSGREGDRKVQAVFHYLLIDAIEENTKAVKELARKLKK